MRETQQAATLQPGTRLRHRNGKVVTLDRRKKESEHDYGRGHKPIPFQSGWWLRGNDGGLADFVIEDENGGWTVLDG